MGCVRFERAGTACTGVSEHTTEDTHNLHHTGTYIVPYTWYYIFFSCCSCCLSPSCDRPHAITDLIREHGQQPKEHGEKEQQARVRSLCHVPKALAASTNRGKSGNILIFTYNRSSNVVPHVFNNKKIPLLFGDKTPNRGRGGVGD